MKIDDLTSIIRLSGIKRKISEDEQGDFERRDAIAKLKKLTAPDPMGGGNHAYVDPKTGTIMYSGNAGGEGNPSPMGSAQQWNDPKNATASVGRELKDLLKQAGLPVTADAKGNARVDPAAFANLGKAPAAAAPAPTAPAPTAPAAAAPAPTATTSAVQPSVVSPGSPSNGSYSQAVPLGPNGQPMRQVPMDEPAADTTTAGGAAMANKPPPAAPTTAPTTAPMSSTGPQAQQDAQNRSEPVTARSQDQINAIKNMQRELGVNPDGKIGPKTKQAMIDKPQIQAKYADSLGGAKQYTGKPATPAKPPASVPGKPDDKKSSTPVIPGTPSATSGATPAAAPTPPAGAPSASVPKMPDGFGGKSAEQAKRDWIQKYGATHNPNGTPKTQTESRDDRTLNLIRGMKL
jgi:hypothetical protein